MTLPVGTISLSQVNTELQLASTTTISLNQANVRSLAGVPSGTISMSNLQGKTYYYYFTRNIDSNYPNYNIKSLAIASGWDQVTPLYATITVNPGYYVYSTSTSAYAFQTGSGFPSGSILILTNNGFILGRGGNGGNAKNYGISGQTAGSVGGPALLAQYPITIANNGSIGGGGGGGGGGGSNG